MLDRRGCGVLLHPTSLPGAGGIGTLGGNCRRFIDLLAAAGMTYWQVLPLNPPSCGNSPYSSFSAFAGNPLLIDLQQLVQEGDLPAVPHHQDVSERKVDFPVVSPAVETCLRQAAAAFLAAETTPRKREFWSFCDTTPWLHDYALFMALKKHYKGKPWFSWPRDVRLLTPAMYEKMSVALGPEIGVQKYIQWQFFRQWHAIHEYAGSRGIAIIGDLPIFVAYDSADVWRNRQIFLLDGDGKPRVVAGVPPDYFSAHGQLWGNPLYDWSVLEQRGFDWWIERFAAAFSCFDCIRIDHFRGFEAAWHVPAADKNAVRGKWVPGPGNSLFQAVFSALGPRAIIAEDLGVITPEVEQLRDRCGFPGMKILQFAFGSGAANPYLPHNHTRNCVVYTGTHDNDTLAGWLHSSDQSHTKTVLEYLGGKGGTLFEDLMRACLMSVANTAVIPFQDLLQLGTEARMNVPGTPFGNWEWRFCWDMVPEELPARLQGMLERYGRLNPMATCQSA